MATKTWTIAKDALAATDGSSNYGAGADAHLPVGFMSWLGGAARSFLQFNLDWTDVVQITSAVLHVRSNSYHGSCGASAAQFIDLVTGSWTEDTKGSDEVWYSNDALLYPGPAVDTTYRVSSTIGRADATWYTVDITNIVNRWAPSTVKQSGGSAGPGTTNRGIRIIAQNEASTTVRTGFSSRDSAYDPYIVLTYTTNAAPSVTPSLPANHGTVSSQTPTIEFTYSDPDGDPVTAWDVQVDTTTGDGVEPDWTGLAASTAGNTSDLTSPIDWVVGATLTRGQWYAWRARATDGVAGYGAWCATQYFYVAKQPTNSMSVPTNGQTARLYYAGGSGTTPKFDIAWSYADADGHAQQSVIVNIYNDNAGAKGTLAYTTTLTQSGQSAQLSGFTPVNGTYYWIEVQSTCTAGVQAAVATTVRTRARWGRASYFYDMGATPPLSWATPVVNSTVPANSILVVEYGASSSASTPPVAEPTYYANLSDVPIPAGAAHVYIWHRVTMFAWGSATPTSPSLQDVTLKWQASAKVADDWTLPAAFSIDTATEVFGDQSLKGTGNGSTNDAYQVISVLPNTNYILSGYIKASGNAGASIRIREADRSADIVSTTAITATQDFTRTSIAFNSGGRTSVAVVCRITGAAATFAWFDALKVEASTIVTPWTPGFIGGGASIDAGGIQVDATAGGVARFRGSLGASRDVIELSTHGWQFGGDSTQIWSPNAGVFELDGPNSTDLTLKLNAPSLQQPNLILGQNSTFDVRLRRGAATRLDIDDGALGAADVTVSGSIRPGLTGVAAAVTTEGYLKWDNTQRALVVGDSVRAKALTPIGFAVIVAPALFSPSSSFATSAALAVVSGGNAGAYAVPFNIPAPMLLGRYRYRNLDTTLARSCEIALFYSKLNNSGTCTQVTGSYQTDSFTAAAASNRVVNFGTPILIPPGSYFLVIRNTSATNTFGLALETSLTLAVAYSSSKAATPTVNAATLDLVTGWSLQQQMVDVVLEGVQPDGSTLY